MLCAQHHGGPCSVALRTPTHPFCTASAPGAKRRRLAVLCVSALPQGSPQVTISTVYLLGGHSSIVFRAVGRQVKSNLDLTEWQRTKDVYSRARCADA